MDSDFRTFVIAEAGVNHNGDLGLALRLVDAAADAGADAVKFQTFHAEQIASIHAERAPYQRAGTPGPATQLEMLRALQLDERDYEALVRHAASRGIQFLSTPFDVPSLDLLIGRFDMRIVKIASGEATNAPFLLAVSRAADRVILSTGMCTLDEVRQALGVLAFGFTSARDAEPTLAGFERSFASDGGRRSLRERVTLLHCTTEYPAPACDANLRAMSTMARTFGLRVGYSDHTAGFHVALAAVALGAEIIEKHFTLGRAMPGPDHATSLEPAELRAMICQIHEIGQALGDGIKNPRQSEAVNRVVARRSLVAATAIRAGDRFGERNLAAKRPATGLTPFAYWDLLGRTADRDYRADDTIEAPAPRPQG